MCFRVIYNYFKVFVNSKLDYCFNSHEAEASKALRSISVLVFDAP